MADFIAVNNWLPKYIHRVARVRTMNDRCPDQVLFIARTLFISIAWTKRSSLFLPFVCTESVSSDTSFSSPFLRRDLPLFASRETTPWQAFRFVRGLCWPSIALRGDDRFWRRARTGAGTLGIRMIQVWRSLMYPILSPRILPSIGIVTRRELLINNFLLSKAFRNTGALSLRNRETTWLAIFSPDFSRATHPREDQHAFVPVLIKFLRRNNTGPPRSRAIIKENESSFSGVREASLIGNRSDRAEDNSHGRTKPGDIRAWHRWA